MKRRVEGNRSRFLDSIDAIFLASANVHRCIWLGNTKGLVHTGFSFFHTFPSSGSRNRRDVVVGPDASRYPRTTRALQEVLPAISRVPGKASSSSNRNDTTSTRHFAKLHRAVSLFLFLACLSSSVFATRIIQSIVVSLDCPSTTLAVPSVSGRLVRYVVYADPGQGFHRRDETFFASLTARPGDDASVSLPAERSEPHKRRSSPISTSILLELSFSKYSGLFERLGKFRWGSWANLLDVVPTEILW